MASMKEIAIGVAHVLLPSRELEPLFVDLSNESPDDPAVLAKAVLAECADRAIALRVVREQTSCWASLGSDVSQGTRIEAIVGL